MANYTKLPIDVEAVQWIKVEDHSDVVAFQNVL